MTQSGHSRNNDLGEEAEINYSIPSITLMGLWRLNWSTDKMLLDRSGNEEKVTKRKWCFELGFKVRFAKRSCSGKRGHMQIMRLGRGWWALTWQASQKLLVGRDGKSQGWMWREDLHSVKVCRSLSHGHRVSKQCSGLVPQLHEKLPSALHWGHVLHLATAHPSLLPSWSGATISHQEFTCSFTWILSWLPPLPPIA